MTRKFCYACSGAVLVFFCVSGAGAQEQGKRQITWDDISGADSQKSLPDMPVVIKSSAPVASQKPGEVIVPEDAPPEIEVKPQDKPLSAAVPEVPPVLEQAAQVSAGPTTPPSEQGIEHVAPKKKSKASREKKAALEQAAPGKAAKQKTPPKEETAWQRASALTDQNEANERNTFVVNPDRE